MMNEDEQIYMEKYLKYKQKYLNIKYEDTEGGGKNPLLSNIAGLDKNKKKIEVSMTKLNAINIEVLQAENAKNELNHSIKTFKQNMSDLFNRATDDSVLQGGDLSKLSEIEELNKKNVSNNFNQLKSVTDYINSLIDEINKKKANIILTINKKKSDFTYKITEHLKGSELDKDVMMEGVDELKSDMTKAIIDIATQENKIDTYNTKLVKLEEIINQNKQLQQLIKNNQIDKQQSIVKDIVSNINDLEDRYINGQKKNEKDIERETSKYEKIQNKQDIGHSKISSAKKKMIDATNDEAEIKEVYKANFNDIKKALIPVGTFVNVLDIFNKKFEEFKYTKSKQADYLPQQIEIEIDDE
jgi:chromosome segregation ATPase